MQPDRVVGICASCLNVTSAIYACSCGYPYCGEECQRKDWKERHKTQFHGVSQEIVVPVVCTQIKRSQFSLILPQLVQFFKNVDYFRGSWLAQYVALPEKARVDVIRRCGPRSVRVYMSSYFVAWSATERRIVGALVAFYRIQQGERYGHWFITDVVVDKSHRGCRIGSALVMSAKSCLLPMNVGVHNLRTHISQLVNPRAKEFFKSAGFYADPPSSDNYRTPDTMTDATQQPSARVLATFYARGGAN